METALVTGASGGIGCELAKLFAKHGIHLVLVARNEKKMEALARQLSRKHGISIKTMIYDLSVPGAPEEIHKQLAAEDLKIDYLVNNAGFGHYGYFANSKWEKEAQLINLNIMALTHMTKLFIRDMIKRGSGRIMNVSSIAAFQPGPLMAVYYASKAYVQSFSEALAHEIRNTGVTITALCPGPTESGFEKAASLEDSSLFKHLPLASARQVAEYGYKKMMAGQTVAIHGTLNKIMMTAVKLLPTKIVVPIVGMLSEKK